MKYLILGAGPSGLSFANALLQRGEKDFLVLESQNQAGGLCRSKMVDGTELDIGGGHFLDVRRPRVTEFLFKFMPKEEWNFFNRDSRIYVNSQCISHPFEANIWQMDVDSQVKYLKSIAQAGCNTGKEMPISFVDWIYWKLGDEIAKDYMIPYNKKIYGNELNELGTYWLNKLPSVNFEDTLYSCLNHKPYCKQPGHAQFYYPKKYGYGELWRRMATMLGNNIIYNQQVSEIDFDTHTVKTDNGNAYSADIIVTTIPWLEFIKINGMPQELQDSISKLKYTSIEIKYHPERLDTKAHWIYFPDNKLSYHRILVRHNFCANSNGYWTETNGDRIEQTDDSNYKYLNKYAYPLNTIDKPEIMQNLLNWCKEHNVYGLGRWGEHEHYNSDLVVELALALAQKI